MGRTKLNLSLLAFLALGTSMTPVCAQPAAPQPKTNESAAAAAKNDDRPSTCPLNRVATLTLTQSGRLYLVDVTVNGKALHFLLDTGAEETVFSEKTAQALNLDRFEAKKVYDISANFTELPTAFVTSIVVGTVDDPQKIFPVAGLSDAYDGILGMSFLTKFDFDVDLPNKSLTLYKPNGCSPLVDFDRSNDLSSVARFDASGRIQTILMLNKVRFPALLDTGAESSIISQAVLNSIQYNGPIEHTNVRSANGTMVDGRIVKVASYTLQDYSFTDLPMVYVPVAPGISSGAFLGVDVLHDIRFWASFAQRRIVPLPSRASAPNPQHTIYGVAADMRLLPEQVTYTPPFKFKIDATSCPLYLLTSLPLQEVNQRYTVAVNIDGKPYNFLLDTGSQVSMVTPEIVSALKLQTVSKIMSSGWAGQPTERPVVTSSEFSVGSYVVPNVRLTSASLETGFDGLLGMDILKTIDFDLDLPAQRLGLYQSNGCFPIHTFDDDKVDLLPPGADFQKDRVFIKTTLAYSRMNTLIDTGSTSTLVKLRAAEKTGVTEEAFKKAPVAGFSGIDGAPEAHYLPFKFLQIEDNQPVVDSNLKVVNGVELPSDQTFDMALGTDYLRQTRFFVSYAYRRFIPLDTRVPGPLAGFRDDFVAGNGSAPTTDPQVTITPPPTPVVLSPQPSTSAPPSSGDPTHTSTPMPVPPQSIPVVPAAPSK